MAETSQTGKRSLMAYLAEIWERTATYFVPAEMAQDRDQSNRARMFLISHTIGPVLGNSVPIALFAFDPTPHVDVLILPLSISLFWVFPFLLRRGVDYNILVVLSVINLNFAVLWSCFHYGGVSSPTLTWILIIPMLSLFYVGGERKLQPYLLAVTTLSIAVFFFAYFFLDPPPNDISDAAMVGLGTVSTIATLCYVATMAIYYARVFDAGVDLEIEAKRRRAMADDLRRAVAQAQRAGSAKSEFLARMSHEIRTPLNAIIGYGQLLKEEAEDAEDELMLEDVARILDAANYLVRLINMVLDLSKIEAGRMRFDIASHHLRDLLEGAVEKRQDLIEEQGITVTLDIEEGLETVETDENRFLQIIDSILENALVHAHARTVTLSASSTALSDGSGAFRVAIADDGKGIAPKALETVFETFATAESASDGRFGGTGLNLTVCHRLCRAMGGNIGAESTQGEGTTFALVLPIAAAEEAAPVLAVPTADGEAQAAA